MILAKRNLPFYTEKTTAYYDVRSWNYWSIFFINNVDENVTVNNDRNCAMIIDCLMHEIAARKLGNIWFQQDGATFQISHQLIDWPQHCDCAIILLDFFLWGYYKVTTRNAQTNHRK